MGNCRLELGAHFERAGRYFFGHLHRDDHAYAGKAVDRDRDQRQSPLSSRARLTSYRNSPRTRSRSAPSIADSATLQGSDSLKRSPTTAPRRSSGRRSLCSPQPRYVVSPRLCIRSVGDAPGTGSVTTGNPLTHVSARVPQKRRSRMACKRCFRVKMTCRTNLQKALLFSHKSVRQADATRETQVNRESIRGVE